MAGSNKTYSLYLIRKFTKFYIVRRTKDCFDLLPATAVIYSALGHKIASVQFLTKIQREGDNSCLSLSSNKNKRLVSSDKNKNKKEKNPKKNRKPWACWGTKHSGLAFCELRAGLPRITWPLVMWHFEKRVLSFLVADTRRREPFSFVSVFWLARACKLSNVNYFTTPEKNVSF